jgi:hypothetical protein
MISNLLDDPRDFSPEIFARRRFCDFTEAQPVAGGHDGHIAFAWDLSTVHHKEMGLVIQGGRLNDVSREGISHDNVRERPETLSGIEVSQFLVILIATVKRHLDFTRLVLP